MFCRASSALDPLLSCGNHSLCLACFRATRVLWFMCSRVHVPRTLCVVAPHVPYVFKCFICLLQYVLLYPMCYCVSRASHLTCTCALFASYPKCSRLRLYSLTFGSSCSTYSNALMTCSSCVSRLFCFLFFICLRFFPGRTTDNNYNVQLPIKKIYLNNFFLTYCKRPGSIYLR